MRTTTALGMIGLCICFMGCPPLVAAPGPPALQLSIIHSFPAVGPEARNPQHALRAGPDGLLYGVTSGGGSANQGVLFQIQTNGANYRTLHTFTKQPGDGGGPVGQVLITPGRVLYGVTESGGSPYGTLYAFNLETKAFRVLHGFAGVADAQYPSAGPILGSDGRLYGVSDRGGTHQQGALYVMATDGSGAGLLHHFKGSQGDGGHPQGPLLETRDEYLYGTTSTGGRFGLGTLFRIRRDGGDYGVLHHFAGVARDVGIPMTCLVEDGLGTLFGVGRAGGGASQGGGIFRIQTDGTGYRQLHGFGAAPGEPRLPGNGLVLTPGGWLLGVTMSGGQRTMGTVFALDKECTMLHVLHHFSGSAGQDGAHPVAPMIRAGECFYGTTEKGGAHNAGTLFKLSLP